MSKNHSICVGATGFGGGVWHSPDGGENWSRIRDPFPLGSQVRAMAVYPDDANRILAGAGQRHLSQRGQRGFLGKALVAHGRGADLVHRDRP